jgi:uncharacterized membrane protein
MSYQIGGYTAILPRSAIQPLNMSVQDTMRFAITAGMKSNGTVKTFPNTMERG